MFQQKKSTQLQNTARFGKIDAPAASEDTLEQFHNLYNSSTEGAEQIHALVLGATPELRDIVLSYGHKLTTVERDEKALKDKTAQMHYAHHPNEEIIISDWLSVHFDPATFDVILGDGVLTALPQTDQQLLLDHLHHWLKPTGSLIIREGAVLHQRPRYAPSVHIHEYRTGEYNLFDLFFGLRLYNQNFKAIDTATRKTYLSSFNDKIKEYFDSGLLSEEEYHRLLQIGAELEHTLLRKEDLEGLLKQLFYPKYVGHDIGSGHLSPWYFFLSQPTGNVVLPKHLPAPRTSYVTDFLAKANATAE
ncbi:MAG: class I SAM-dependent methyltransferase [Patescibacteria group bacterium]